MFVAGDDVGERVMAGDQDDKFDPFKPIARYRQILDERPLDHTRGLHDPPSADREV